MFPLLALDGDLPTAAACATEELVELMAAHGRAESAHAQRKLAVVAELDRRRQSADTVAQTCGARPGEFVAAEVAVGLTVSKGIAACLLEIGLALNERLPATKQAFARGALDFGRVRVIVERTSSLSDALVAVVEPRILDRALTPGRELIRARLGSVIDRIVATADPDGATARRHRAERDRDVQVRPGADGMSSLWGLLRGVDGPIVEERLRAMAVGVCGSDPRTLSQRRADALTALALGADHLACTCSDPGCPCRPERPATPRVLIQVMIDAATLTGGAQLPGVLAGYGAIDADLARELAADASWQQLLTDTSGAITAAGPVLPGGCVPDAGSSAWRYRPSEKLARLVRARDGQCRFPNCGVAAARCDLDHILAFNHDDPHAGGSTIATNLQCLCRWHHRLKTFGDWQVRALAKAIMRWTSPSGTIHNTTPAGGSLLSHHDPDDDPAGADCGSEHPIRYDTSANERCAEDGPSPWDGFDWHSIEDRLSPKEYAQYLQGTRPRRAPPDPDAAPIIQVVSCTCPPPF